MFQNGQTESNGICIYSVARACGRLLPVTGIMVFAAKRRLNQEKPN